MSGEHANETSHTDTCASFSLEADGRVIERVAGRVLIVARLS